MTFTPTNLPNVANGQIGRIADTQTAWDAIDDLTANAASTADVLAVRYVSAGSGDQRAALNTWLADGNALGIKQLVGAFNISDSLSVPAGVYLDLTRATITQTGTGKTSLSLGAGSSVIGGTLVGKGSDYVSGASPTALGITASGDGGSVRGTTLSNFSGAAIRGYGVTNFKIANVTIVGVGAPTIVAGDGGPCDGILLDLTSRGVFIDNVDISNVCQGILAGSPVTHISISNTRIHDVQGQHGAYIQNGTGLNISGLDISNCNLNGLKVQKSVSDAADDIGGTIVGVTADSCGDTGIIFNNTASDLTGAKVFRGFTVANISAANCLRGAYFGSLVESTIANVAAYNSTTDAVTFVNCRDIQATNVLWATCGRIGIRFTSATGSTQDRIAINGIRGNNPAGSNDGTNLEGIYLAQGSNISIDNATVTADNGFMRYAFYVASATAGDQRTLSLRNSDFSGSTVSARFQASTTTVKAWSGNMFTGTVLNRPTGFSALVNLVGSASSDAAGSQNALLGASFDPALGITNLSALTAGVLFLAKVQVPDGGALNSAWFVFGVAGSGLTSGQNLVGIYDAVASGAILGTSADQSATSFLSAGLKQVAMSSATSSILPGASVYLAFLFNGTTGPALRGVSGSATGVNANTSTAPRFATAGTSLTALPSTLPAMTAVFTPAWAGVS